MQSFHIKNKLAIALCSIYSCYPVYGKDVFNLDFINGGAKENIPSLFYGENEYYNGEYVVDLIFNEERLGRSAISILSGDTKNNICFAKEWIENNNIPISDIAFEDVYDKQRKCYTISKFPGAKVDFDTSSQTLTFSVPQIAIVERKDISDWDYGIPGVRLTYSANATKKTNDNVQAYGDLDFNSNYGRWVLAASANVFSESDDKFEMSDATLSTALSTIRGNLIMGKSQTANTNQPDFNYYGVSIRSDNNMVPWNERGYAPVISGVANTNARITVKQGDYTIYSKVVPPGAYSIRDITPVGNGDLTVITEESDGSKTTRIYPVNTLPTLLRAGEFNYDFSLGMRERDVDKNGGYSNVFALASIDYGFIPVTTSGSIIIHKDYQNVGFGLTKDFGFIGTSSINFNLSRSKQDDLVNSYSGRYQTGASATVKYAKGLSDSTSLQLLTYQYTGEKYIDFSDFNLSGWIDYNRYKRKDRYESIITKSFKNSFVSASGWIQNYRNAGTDVGGNLSFSYSLSPVTLSVNANYGKYHNYNDDDYGLSLGVSIPFSSFNKSHYSNSSIGYNNGNGTTFNSGVSGSLTEQVSYNASAAINGNGYSSSLYTGVALEPLQIGMAVSQGDGYTALSASASGTIIGTAPTGIVMSREQNDTLAVVKVEDLPDITFNTSKPTNRDGVTLVGLSAYHKNDIRIDTNNIPYDVELVDSVHSVVPTNRAIVYREFGYEKVSRYIVKLIGSDGNVLLAGGQAMSDKGSGVGFVSDGGILIMSLLTTPSYITIKQGNGRDCQFSMKSIASGDSLIKEVKCEQI